VAALGFYSGTDGRGSVIAMNIVRGIMSLVISVLLVGAFISDLIQNLVPDDDLVVLIAMAVSTVGCACVIFFILTRIAKTKPKELKSTTLDADLIDQQNDQQKH